MNQNSINRTITLSILYLFFFFSPLTSIGEERRLPEWYLDVYYKEIDNFLYQETPYYIGFFPLSKALPFQKNPQSTLKNLQKNANELKAALEEFTTNYTEDSGPIKDNEEYQELVEDNQIIQLEVKQMSFVDYTAFVPRRYSDIDSYVWNSLYINYDIGFWDITTENNWGSNADQSNESSDANLLIYPASRINIPEWSEAWKQMYFDRRPQTPFYQFLVMSAPLSQKTMMTQNLEIPKAVELDLKVEVPNDQNDEVFEELNHQDLNMIFFFKSLIEENVETIFAICSDPDLNQSQKQNLWKLVSGDSARVLSKCHYYWKINFTINYGDEIISVKSKKVELDPAPLLYNKYDLEISSQSLNNDEVNKKVVSVYVLGNWPDHQRLPTNMYNDMLGLFDIMFHLLHPDYEHGSELLEVIEEDTVPPRIVIHCSAGVGRTGTMIFGYQMYEQMRFLDNESSQDNETVFAQLLNQYQPTELYGDFMKTFEKYKWNKYESNLDVQIEQSQKRMTIPEMLNLTKTSHVLPYMFDTLLNYRLYRNLFVQTLDQFHWLIYFSTILKYKDIRENYILSEKNTSTNRVEIIEEQVQDDLTSNNKSKSKLLQKNESGFIDSSDLKVDRTKIRKMPSEIIETRKTLVLEPSNSQLKVDSNIKNHIYGSSYDNSDRKTVDVLSKGERDQLDANKKRVIEMPQDKNSGMKKYSINGIVCSEEFFLKMQQKIQNKQTSNFMII